VSEGNGIGDEYDIVVSVCCRHTKSMKTNELNLRRNFCDPPYHLQSVASQRKAPTVILFDAINRFYRVTHIAII